VFSYGRFDNGARALLECAEVREGDRILDLGCGVGAVGVFAARMAGPGGHVTFVDSNVRAVEVSRLNAESNGLADFRAHATATMGGLPEADFDVVLANPPYHARLDIARRFVEGSPPLMKPGGRFFVVTKQPNGVAPMVEEAFGNVTAYERRGYTVILGRTPFRSAE
jgi:16S rRNA (guanine1207-N2)-methyltransferase